MKLTELTQTEYASISESKVESIKQTKGFAEITRAFDKVLFETEEKQTNQSTLKNFWFISKREVENIPVTYTKEDITQFVFSLAEKSEKEIACSGVFLTDLIMNHYKKNRLNRFLKNTKNIFSLKTFFSNTSTSDEYIIVTENLPPISYLGHDLNGPKIKVLGDIGNFLGQGMKKGKITITGNARDNCGYEMSGGYIKIVGDAGNSVGKGMKDGTTHVLGNAEYLCGARMINGHILIDGNVKNDTGYEMKKGFIFIKGNAGKHTASFMRGGILKIKGNTGKNCGEFMKGGLITIQGNCDNYCGYQMEEGTIHIKGNVGYKLGNKMRKGRIFVEGKYYGELEEMYKGEGSIFLKETLMKKRDI